MQGTPVLCLPVSSLFSPSFSLLDEEEDAEWQNHWESTPACSNTNDGIDCNLYLSRFFVFLVGVNLSLDVVAVDTAVAVVSLLLLLPLTSLTSLLSSLPFI